MRLLIVEDEDAIRSALARALGRGAVTVATAASLAEARREAAAFRPEALLSDLKLPDGSGLDLARELAVPFALMSGYATVDDAVAAMRLGCIDLFTKPVSLADVRKAVERLAGRADSPALCDPEAGAWLRCAVERIEAAPLAWSVAAWNAPERAADAFAGIAPRLPHLALRAVTAELMRAVPAGRLVVNRQGAEWLVALRSDAGGADPEARSAIDHWARRTWWRADGAVARCEAEAETPWQPAAEWWWPRDLPAGECLDLSGVAALGSWCHGWFRDRPYQAVANAVPTIRAHLHRIGLPVLWRDPVPARDGARTAVRGVGAAERALLLGDG